MARAVIDSVIHLLFSRRCPITIQAVRSNTNKVIALTEVSLGPVAAPKFIKKELILKPMKPLQSQIGTRNSLFIDTKTYINSYVY